MPAASSLTPRVNTDELIAASDALVEALVTPPTAAARVCPLCHSWKPDELTVCDSCDVTGESVGFPVGPVSVVTLTTKPSSLRDWLTRYKGRPGEEDPFEHESFDHVRALAGRYLLEHGATLHDRVGGIDSVVVVPSAGDRPVPHPFEQILTELRFDVPVERLLVRGPGVLGFRRSSADGYVCREQSDPRRVLLVEDVFVTGARAYSAGRALQDGGHTVAGVLVLARRINRDWGESQQLWDSQEASSFDWSSSPLIVPPDDELLDRLRFRPRVRADPDP